MQSEALHYQAPVPRWERRIVGWLGRNVWLRNRRGGPWPVPPGLDWEPVTFAGNTGARVAGRYFFLDASRPRGAQVLGHLAAAGASGRNSSGGAPPAAAPGRGSPRGVVVCVHPDRRYAQHWFVKEGWVEWLTGHGFEVLTFDLPFYGETQGPAHYYPEDVIAAVAFARRWSGGLPVHVVGLSIGAFAVANAAPFLDDVESLVLESPYPNFTAWYGPRRGRWASRLLDILFPRTIRLIQADRNLAKAKAKRILVAAATDDEITGVRLSRAVAQAAPQDRTRYLELAGVRHLELFQRPEYKEAALEALGVTSTPASSGEPHSWMHLERMPKARIMSSGDTMKMVSV